MTTTPALYDERRAYGDSQLHTIKQLIADATCTYDLLLDASPEVDQTEATDLIHSTNGKRYAVRCRDFSYLSPYYGQYTIRTSKGRDGQSELDKITKLGGIDYFTCFIDSNGWIRNWYLFHVTPAMLAQPIEQIHRDHSHFNVYFVPFANLIASEENRRSR